MTNLDSSSPQTTAPGTSTPTYGEGGRRAAPAQTGWVGMVVFAATIMIMMGIFHAIAGLVAIFKDNYYLVGKSGLVVQVDYTAWGWTYLIGGCIIAGAGVALLAGQMWARVVGVVLAVGSAILNMAFFSAYPWWSAIMITLDVLVIWALTVHGAEIKNERQ